MSESLDFGFGKLVPGFDFLQSLAKGAAQSAPQVPNMGSWVAPTLDTEELDKRVAELKTVQFWLEQNANAIKATIQALEVQKMTVSALKGMNVSIGDMAEAFKIKTPPSSASPKTASDGNAESPAGGAPPIVDPMQWWGALTDQFQQIASAAMKDVSAAAAKQSVSKTRTATAEKPVAKKPVAKKSAASESASKAANKLGSKSANTAAKKTVARTSKR